MDKLKIALCEGCGQPVLAGRVQGFRTRLDPAALTLTGQVLARLDGRTLHHVTPTAGGAVVSAPHHIEDNRHPHADPVLAAHRHDTWPAHTDDTATRAMLADMTPPTVGETNGRRPPY